MYSRGASRAQSNKQLSNNSFLDHSMVRNSSLPYAIAFLEKLGCEVVFTAHLSGNAEHYKGQLENVLEQHSPQILLTTGAVSMGEADFVPQCLNELGARKIFHNVAMQPGKPNYFARLRNTLIFGCPGNPVSTAAALHFFVKEALALGNLPPVRATLGHDVRKPQHLECFYRACLDEEGRVHVDGHQASSDAVTLANGVFKRYQGVLV